MLLCFLYDRVRTHVRPRCHFWILRGGRGCDLNLTELALWPTEPGRRPTLTTPSSPLCFLCSKCGTLPPESCFFSLICSTGSFMGECQHSSIQTENVPTCAHIQPTCSPGLNEALCTHDCQACFLSCKRLQPSLCYPESTARSRLWGENIQDAMNGAFLNLRSIHLLTERATTP